MAQAPLKKAPTKIPHNLAGWQDSLHQLVLPIDPSVKAAALQKLNASTGNAKNIAQILRDDPAISLLLFHQANKSLGKSGNEAHSLAHALSLLGFPRAESIIRQAPEYDKANFPLLAEFRQQLSISLHAAHQAEAWAAQNPHWPQDTLFWSTLFHRAPIWALWYHAGEAMEQLQQTRASKRGATHSQFEKHTLGTSLQTLAAILSRSWHLPSATQQSWQPSMCGNARQWIMLSRIIPEQSHIALSNFPRLQQVCRSPGFVIALANRFADEAEWQWQCPRTLRLQKILATALNLTVANGITLTHRQAINATRHNVITNTLSPARQLFSAYNKADALKSKKLATPSTPAATTTSTTTATGHDKPTKTTTAAQNPLLANAPSDFVDAIKRLQQQPDTFNSVHEIMNFAVTTLCQSINLERASVSLVNPQSKELRTFFSSGSENNPALKNFRHTLQRGDLFNKLLQKPLSLRLQASNYPQIWPLLPGNFKQACGADEFLMMSVFANKKPRALIYADRGISNRPLNDQQYALFKQLCSAVSHCLQQFENR